MAGKPASKSTSSKKSTSYEKPWQKLKKEDQELYQKTIHLI